MPDYGREVRFGYFLVPDAGTPLVRIAQEAERLGLDYVAIQDHPYQRRFVDTWVLMSMIAASTTRIGIFPDVTNLALRPPAVLAKSAASLDVLSGGRFELGLGAGGFQDAIVAYGGPRRTPGEALGALEEAIEVIRLVWSGQRNLRFTGRHYKLAGAHSGPVPAHAMGIWLGTYGPRALDLTARAAHGWVPSLRGDLDRLLHMARDLDAAAARHGRDPGEIRRIVNVGGTITDGPSEGLLNGPVSRWAEELTDLAVGYGFDTFVFTGEADQLARFANEVVPATRESIARERGATR